MKKLFKAVLTATTLAGMLAIPIQVNAGADSTEGDILGIAGSDTTYFVMNALTDAHNLSARYNPNGDKAVNIPPLVSANANVEAGEATLASVSWLKKGRLAWPGGAVLPADANCTTQYVFGGAGSMDGNVYATPTPSTTIVGDGDVADATDTPFTNVTSVPGGPTGGTYDVRLGVQPPNGSGDGQKAIKGTAVKGVTYGSGCLDIGRSSSAPSSSNSCGTPANCESWAFALDAIGWTYFPGNTQPAVSSGIISADMNNIFQCATANLDVNGDGDYFDTGDTTIGYPKIQYWNQLTAGSNVSTEPTKIAPYRIQPGSGTGNDVATIFYGRGTSNQNTDAVVLAGCDGYPSATANDKDGNTATSFTFPIVQEHDCRNVADADKARAICFYGYSRWVLQARSLETDKRNGALFGKFGPNTSELKRPSFSTINTTDSRYKGTRYVYNVLPLNGINGALAGDDYARTPDARRFVGVSLQPAACATNATGTSPNQVVSEVTASADCNLDGDLTDTSVAIGAVPGFICGDATARRIITSFGFKPIPSGVTSTTNSALGTSYCRQNQAALAST